MQRASRIAEVLSVPDTRKLPGIPPLPRGLHWYLFLPCLARFILLNANIIAHIALIAFILEFSVCTYQEPMTAPPRQQL